jgi:hypothetical protein
MQPDIFVCLLEARKWISNASCRVFFCVQWFEQYVLDKTMQEQTQITRREPVYKQLEVNTNRTLYLCENRTMIFSNRNISL